MSRQVKVMLVAMVIMSVVLMPLLAGCRSPGPVEEMPEIKIGIVGAMKFLSGEHTWWGAQLAAEKINAAGGVNVGGVIHEIKLIKADDNNVLSVTDAKNAMEKLVTVDRVNVIVGGYKTEAVLAQQEVMADHRVIFMGAGSAHPEQSMRVAEDYERYKYWFRVAPVNSIYLGRIAFALTEMVGEVVRQELGIQTPKVALLFEKTAWVEPMIPAANKLLPEMGMEVVGLWMPSMVATDLTAELTAIKAAGAHIIMPVLSGPVGVVYAKQWSELEIPAASAGINVEAQGPKFWEATRGKAEYEVVFDMVGRVAQTERTIPFYDAFVERFGAFPIYNAAGAYDALYILKEAIERADTLDSDAVIVELEKTDFQGAQGRIVFTGMDSPYPHDLIWGPGYVTGMGFQWRDGERRGIWPHGQAAIGDKAWVGIRHEGTVDYELPPWVVEHWKGQ
jgi:branched-chain amino acid transport system substrate-binding protein